MEHLNFVHLRGHVGTINLTTFRDVNQDKKIASLSVVTNFAYRSKDGMAIVDSTWHLVKAIEGIAAPLDVLESIHKGSAVEINGRIRAVRYAGSDGVERNTYEIVASELTLLVEKDFDAAPQQEKTSQSDNQPAAKRHHPLKVGEMVFDSETMRAGFIVDIKPKETATDGLNVTLRANDDWNRKYMDLDTEKDSSIWDAYESDLYQFADGLEDRNGNPVCYEHQETRDNYPYYSPVENENMFSFEVCETNG